MQTTFKVEITAFKKISAIEQAWSGEAYKALLELMGLNEGLDGLPAAELEEMCLMSLSDFEPPEAARFVLTYLFADELTEGKIDQLSHEMPEDRLWEEFSDCHCHRAFFNAYGLLRRAFNGTFPEPTGVQCTVDITAEQAADFEVFAETPQAPLIRLLAAGMEESAILNRLYDEHISGDSFPEAAGILWDVEQVSLVDLQAQYTLTSSAFWFGGLEEIHAFEGQTHADTVAEDEEA